MNPAQPSALFNFDNSYVRELADFYVRWEPSPASKPRLAMLNAVLAEELRLDPGALASPEGVAMLVGNQLPPGAEPIAQAYAGHQFGGFSPKLGDGRALLLGEVIDRDGRRRDIAFKGSGRTPFSRSGDGKCALGPALREYIVGEAMHALGIPTTRALAVVATGDLVRRERPLPGAVLTRIAASHLRVGTFEFFAAHRGVAEVKRLADYTLARHDPALIGSEAPYLGLLEAVCERQAALVARWLGVGFIHGVMNTDNMTLSGETIDYGPCAFMEHYDPATVFSSIDTQGRYAYDQQGQIAQWNLARLAETLLPLIDADSERAIERATAVIVDFPNRLDRHWLAVMRAKLGLDASGEESHDHGLAKDFLAILHRHAIDFTLAFRDLYDQACGQGNQYLNLDDPDFAAWQRAWRQRQPARDAQLLERMRLANPYLIARNHRVEEALEAAVERFDLGPCRRLVSALQTPFERKPDHADLAEPAPREVTASYHTFCGT